MSTDPTFSQFASPARSSQAEIERQHLHVVSREYVSEILEALPLPAMLINEERQAVLGNESLLELLGGDDPRGALGQRPGELVSCIHSAENAAGCGTTESCSVCGAVLAILRSQRQHVKVSKECRITASWDGTLVPLELMVTAMPLDIEETPFTVVTLTDISHEKRRRALERIFFHDIINTAGGVQSLLELVRDEDDPRESRELLELAEDGASQLVRAIQSQRLLAAAEHDELALDLTTFDALGLVQSVVGRYRGHVVGQGCEIAVAANSESVAVESDQALMERVLGNMLKNALEASDPGERVTVGCRRTPDGVALWVHNPAVMPREAQLQVFQRSYSTKGVGRGLGTYSMKLLTERYLKGKIWFTSVEGEGTTFRVEYPLSLS